MKLSKAEKQFLRHRECEWCGMRLYPLACGSMDGPKCNQANLEDRARRCLKTIRRRKVWIKDAVIINGSD